MASTPYNVGTITVANGATSVAGTDTYWVGKVRQNDMLFIPAQGLMARVTSDPTDNEAMAITAFPGTSLTDAAYEIIPAADSTTNTARLRDLLAQMSVIEANGRGLFYRFSDSVTDADPSSGYLRLNSATIGSATAAYIDNLDANGATATGELDSWDDGTSLVKGRLWLRSIADPSAFHAFKVTGSVVDGTGYRKLTLAYVGGSGSFAADEALMVFFVQTGDAGDGFAYDEVVANTAALAALEGEAAGYLVFVTDLGTDFGAYTGRSGVVRLIAGPDWELVAMYTGLKGDTGNQGDKGWSPKLVVIADGTRRVFKLDSYVGGAGTAPTTNVGQYLKGDGTFTATIGDAVDIRGVAGLNGAGTVASVDAGEGIAVDLTDPTAPVISISNDLMVTVSLLALQVADNSNVALFLGDAANRVADSFDTITYVYLPDSDELDTSTAGTLKPSKTVGPRNATGTSPNSQINDNNPATSISPPLGDLSAASVATRELAYIDFGSVVPLSRVSVSASYPGGLAGCGIWYSNDNSNFTQLGSNFSITGSLATYTRDGLFSARYIAFIVPQAVYSGTAVTLAAIDGFSQIPANMTVASTSFTAASVPSAMKALIQVKENEAATAGTDYTMECSRDGGTTWATMSLTEKFSTPSGLRVVETAEVDVTGQPSGTAPRWRFKTLNNKDVELRDVYFYWD